MKKLIIAAVALAFAGCAKQEGRPEFARAGQPAPEIKLEHLVSGDLKSVSGWADLKGKAVVLEFWWTDCEPCVENIPHLNELAEKFKGKPIVFLSLTREPAAPVAAFLKTHEIKGSVAVEAGAAFRSFKVIGVPHTVLIDKEGVVRSVTYPSDVDEKTLEDLLAGRGPAAAPVTEGPPPAPGEALSFFSVSPSNLSVPSLSFSDMDFNVDGLNLRAELEMALQDTHGVDFKDAPKDLMANIYKISAKINFKPAADNSRILRDFMVAGFNGAFPFKVSVVKRNRKVYLLKTAGAAKGLTLTAGHGGTRRSSRENDVAAMTADGAHMYELARELEGWLQVPVLDETGLGDKQYKFNLRITPVSAKGAGAALESLGLKLVEANRDVEVAEITGTTPPAPKKK